MSLLDISVVEDLFRRAYPGSPELVEENALKLFLDKYVETEEFRLAVKSNKLATLQETVKNAMEGECLKIGEREMV